MNFRQMTIEDLKIIEEHALYPVEPKNGKTDNADYDFVLEHGDYILAAGGFRMITETTAWAWIQLTEFVGPHLIPTYRVIKEWMEIWCISHNIHRLQAWVASGFEEGKRTAEHLGFRKEYKMIDFLGQGKDCWMYVRFMENE